MFDLDPIGARMPEFWVTEAMLEGAVAGKQHQAFAIVIEPANGIDVGNGDEVFEERSTGGSAIAELAQNVVGLIE